MILLSPRFCSGEAAAPALASVIRLDRICSCVNVRRILFPFQDSPNDILVSWNVICSTWIPRLRKTAAICSSSII